MSPARLSASLFIPPLPLSLSVPLFSSVTSSRPPLPPHSLPFTPSGCPPLSSCLFSSPLHSIPSLPFTPSNPLALSPSLDPLLPCVSLSSYTLSLLPLPPLYLFLSSSTSLSRSVYLCLSFFGSPPIFLALLPLSLTLSLFLYVSPS